MKEKAKRARLQRRISAWSHMMESQHKLDQGPRKRASSGGYRCPGSPKQN
jgi:hypothetical protein